MNPAQAYQTLLQIAEPNHEHTNQSGAIAMQAAQVLRPLVDAWISENQTQEAQPAPAKPKRTGKRKAPAAAPAAEKES